MKIAQPLRAGLIEIKSHIKPFKVLQSFDGDIKGMNALSSRRDSHIPTPQGVGY